MMSFEITNNYRSPPEAPDAESWVNRILAGASEEDASPSDGVAMAEVPVIDGSVLDLRLREDDNWVFEDDLA